jgi:hypothetical protein
VKDLDLIVVGCYTSDDWFGSIESTTNTKYYIPLLAVLHKIRYVRWVTHKQVILQILVYYQTYVVDIITKEYRIDANNNNDLNSFQKLDNCGAQSMAPCTGGHHISHASSWACWRPSLRICIDLTMICLIGSIKARHAWRNWKWRRKSPYPKENYERKQTRFLVRPYMQNGRRVRENK